MDSCITLRFDLLVVKKAEFSLVSGMFECYETAWYGPQSVPREGFMAAKISYDHQLRAIGQSLEAQRINNFELKCRGDHFVVNGKPEKEMSLMALLREWQKRLRSEGLVSSLTYASHDIENLERQGRTRRANNNRLPDFYSLPNTLRTLGSYLDLKGAELLEIQKRSLSVTLLYRNIHGHPDFEERSIASFYKLFLDLHDKRGKAGTRSDITGAKFPQSPR